MVDLYSSTVGETNQDKSNDIDSKYTQLIRRIKEAAVATIGEYTIKPNTDYTKKDPAVKDATKTKKHRKKEYVSAIKTRQETFMIRNTLNEYITAQKDLRTAIQGAEQERAQHTLSNIANEGGTHKVCSGVTGELARVSNDKGETV